MELIHGFIKPFEWFLGLFSPVVLETTGIMIGFSVLVLLVFFVGILIIAFFLNLLKD